MSVATFSCPHCAAVYPFKPVFVGKTVRCKTCAKPFTVQSDGTAIPAVPVVTAATVQAAAAQTATVQAAAPVKTTVDKGSERIAFNKQQQATRDKMSASLSQAMGAAAAKSDSKPTTERTQKKGPARKGPDGKAQLGPAILTGEGEREAKISRQWNLSLFAIAVLIGTAVWWLNQDNPRTAAIVAFTEELPQAQNPYGRRLEAHRARALISAEAFAAGPITVFISMPDVRFGGVNRVSGTTLQELAGRFKVAPADLKAATKLTNDAGLDEDAGRVVISLLLGETGPGVNAIRTKLDSGNAPKELEWCTFWGQQGTHLQDVGGNYKFPIKPYRGILARFTGDGWSGPWRILTLGPDRQL